MSLESTCNRVFGEFQALDLTKVPELQHETRKTRHKNDIISDLLGIKRDQVVSEAQKQSLKEYLAKYCASPELGQYLFGEDFALTSDRARVDEDAIINRKFQDFVGSKGYFNADDPKAHALYKACYVLCEHRASFIENNNTGDEVASRAFNMMALFSPGALTEDNNANAQSTFQNLDGFIKKHANTFPAPIHDLFMHELPIYKVPNGIEEFNLVGWKEKLPEFGMELVRNFSDVPKIEQNMATVAQPAGAAAAADAVISNIPATKKELEEALRRASYIRYGENPEFAKIFKYYKTPEATFNRALDLISDGTLKVDGTRLAIKPEDNISDVSIQVSDSIYMVKLPAHNPRSLILGQITNCCQSVGGHSEKCVIDGVNLSNNGFYVLIKGGKGFDPSKIDWDRFDDKTHKIIGQAYVWRGKEGELTLDSLEVLESFRTQVNVIETMKKLGESINGHTEVAVAGASSVASVATPDAMSPSITRIMLGKGGGTGAILKAQKITLPNNDAPPASMLEGRMYGDSQQQYEVYVSDQLEKWRIEAKKLLGIETLIASEAQLRVLQSFNQSQIDEVKRFEDEEILSLISANVRACYAGDPKLFPTFDQLKNYDAKRIRALTSDNAIKCYSDTSGHLPIFNQLNGNRGDLAIMALTSDNAIKCYSNTSDRFPTFDQLKKGDYRKIKALTSDNSIKCYSDTSGRLPTFAQLHEGDYSEIKPLTSDNAIKCYQDQSGLLPKFDQLKDSNSYEIEDLTSDNAIKCYSDPSGRFPTFDQLVVLKCEAELFLGTKIPALTSDNARACYAGDPQFFPTFNQLKEFSVSDIAKLTSQDTMQLYVQGKALQDVCKELNIQMPVSLTVTADASRAPLPQTAVERFAPEGTASRAGSAVDRLHAQREQGANAPGRVV